MLKRLRKSFRSKKKKSTEEKIPPRLQNRIRTPGDRVDCQLNRWSEGTISTSSGTELKITIYDHNEC